MTKDPVGTLVWIALVLLLIFSGGGIVGKPAPFKTDKLAVLIVEDTTQRTTALDALYDAVETSVLSGSGVFRRLDVTQVNLSMDEVWVQEAWKVKGSPPPWIVAANAKTGVNQALPLDPVAAVKLVQPLGGK